ncbi:hypothetical protein [Streptomyces sp. NPDC058279]|uniref:hypothetical protein n=1 Tax=Streptomyces sp. NPDC058279 TaxID=3346418 RepID=UPI0036EDC036
MVIAGRILNGGAQGDAVSREIDIIAAQGCATAVDERLQLLGLGEKLGLGSALFAPLAYGME